MQHEVIFSGFGGQGVLFAGQLLAHAAMQEGRHVTWIPSYGPEMRGGTANCTVVVSDEPIGSPLVGRPSIVVAFNNPSMIKYCDLVKPGGLLVVNSSIVEATTERKDISVVLVPATDAANTLGDARLTNMVLSGAMLAARPIILVQSLRDTLTARLPRNKQHLLQTNLQAIDQGAVLARMQIVST
jgi:2-oxoglutarate ferredoxin oxidoreductase subunit gamma